MAEGPGDGFAYNVVDDGIFIAFRNPDSGSVHIDRGGIIRRLSNPVFSGELNPELSDTATLWRTIGLLQIDHELLQTFAEFKSGKRLLVATDLNGNFLRKRTIPVQLSFITSDSDAHRLLAARKVNKTELVLYRWRWVNKVQ